MFFFVFTIYFHAFRNKLLLRSEPNHSDRPQRTFPGDVERMDALFDTNLKFPSKFVFLEMSNLPPHSIRTLRDRLPMRRKAVGLDEIVPEKFALN